MSGTCKVCKFKSNAAKVLSDKEVEVQSKNCVELTFNKGDVIIREGSLASNVAFLKEGLVKLHMKGPVFEQIVKLIKAPLYLALSGTFGDKINHYSVTALKKSTVCFIDVSVFMNFVMENPKFTRQLTTELCRNEIISFRRCVNRTQKQVRGSIAEILLFFSDEIYRSNEYDLPITREEFGNLVDASRETVSRVLSEFHSENIIELDKNHIKIIQRDTMEIINKNG